MCEAARLQGRQSRALEKLDDFVDELGLPGGKLVGDRFLQKPRQDAGVNHRGVERPELVDLATKLAGPQQHLVVLNIVNCHGSGHAVPDTAAEETASVIPVSATARLLMDLPSDEL